MPFQLLDLPAELIDLIVQHVYLEGGRLIRAIDSLSLTCRALRSAAKPLIFAALTIETNTYYINTDRAPRWLNDGKALSLVHVMPHIRDSISLIRFVSWRRRTHSSYVTDAWRFPENLSISGFMPRLRTIVFDPPHTSTRNILRSLDHGGVHIIFEYRNHDSPASVTMLDPIEHSNSVWSIATGAGHQGATEVCTSVVSRLKALQWAYPTVSPTLRSHVRLLDALHSSPLLEELHFSERIVDLDERFARSVSYATQICGLVSTLPHLKRLRIEGNELSKAFLVILPSLVSLQELSIYSVYRRLFHPTCDLEDARLPKPQTTTGMPWLKLPNLRKLDLRFVCKHFAMEQLIPQGLTSLRIEFYGAEERITLEDMDWLVKHCPNLEQLELDMGLMDNSNFQAKVSGDLATNSSQILHMMDKLRGLHHLRTLRLFPSYWFKGKLYPHPFAGSPRSVGSAVKIFNLLRSICSSLQLLIVSISFGEYPFDAVPRMSLTSRPMKFVLKNMGVEDNILVRWGYGADTVITEAVYKGNTAVRDTEERIIPVLAKYFFDDLSQGWVLPHYELDG